MRHHEPTVAFSVFWLAFVASVGLPGAAAQPAGPAVRITSPADGAVLSPGFIRIEVEAQDQSAAVWRIQLFTNGVYLGVITNAPFTFPWSNAWPGRHVLEARAFNTGGGFSNSEPIHVQVGNGGPIRLVAGPYLQCGSSTGMVIRWRTDWFCDSVARWGSRLGIVERAATNSTLSTEHELAFGELEEDTVYYYAVGSSTTTFASGLDYQFRTSPTRARPVRFWAIGDSGTADVHAVAVRNAYDEMGGPEQTDFWLMLGDNAYFDGFHDDYTKAVFQVYPRLLRRAVLWPALGNHDAGDIFPGVTTGYRASFTLPTEGQAGGVPSGTELYYSFDYANIHLICLDSHNSDRSTNGPMWRWLEQDLAATAKDWIIAYWHHPPYSWGEHNSDLEQPQIEMRQWVLPLLESYGVDLVLNGHSHVYERSFLIHGHYGASGTLQPGMVLDGSPGQPLTNGPYRKPAGGLGSRQGAVYVVCGCSGQGGTQEMLRHPAMAVALSGFGSMVFDVDGLELRGRFLRPDFTFDDEFVINKSASATIRPELKIVLETNGFRLRWPTSVPAFVLEAGQDLGGGQNPWRKVETNVTTIGRMNSITVEANSTNRFFRLRSPNF